MSATQAQVMLNQLARYAPAMALVEEVGGSTLLEVGSGSAGAARFAGEHWSITACDRDFTDYGTVDRPKAEGQIERVDGDVTDLPFGPRSFDVVLALDLLEHIRPADREKALAELVRVTARRLIVGCPCGTTALRSDRRLARYYAAIPFRSAPVWLEEHLENGFPDETLLCDSLDTHGKLRVVPNERVWTHELVSLLEAIPLAGRLCSHLGRLLQNGVPGRVERPSRFAVAMIRLLRGGDREPTYRRIAVLDRSYR